MAYALVQTAVHVEQSWIKRFDPRFWTINFPRPTMAAITTTAHDGLRVDCAFHLGEQLVGLIWEAEDRFDPPILAYATNRDFSGCRLSFDWASSGIKPLDGVNGPVLTIEGRDAIGETRTWYVRLWNYAGGTPTAAHVSLDFDALDGGFLLPGEADPVWPQDIDRMFISLLAEGEGGEASVTLSNISCEGSGSMLAIGDPMVPPHRVSLATGYDDQYNQTPERLLRAALQLGYREDLLLYVGMSHFMALRAEGEVADGLCQPARAWLADWLARAGALGFSPILSLSYELFDEYCPEAWKQRAWDGTPGQTGWTPPSALLSPASDGAMGWLQTVGAELAELMIDAGLLVRFQIGEPWWWVMPDGRPCLYDDEAQAVFGVGVVEIPDVKDVLGPEQIALLDAAGALLAASTLALRDAVKAVDAEAEVLLLVYLPSILDAAAPELKRANLPIDWAAPAFDRLQTEDYDWVTQGRTGDSARGAAAITQRLGCPVADQHYLSGFVLGAEDDHQWAQIDDAVEAATKRGVARTFIWAAPQVARDGYVRFAPSQEEEEMQAFDDVDFPIAIGREAMAATEFATAITVSASGHEQRNSEWAEARMRYDAGPGVRSEADLALLAGFFRARRGAARGFRFTDPFDHQATDAPLGLGDGIRSRFDLVKDYGDDAFRRITRPLADSVSIKIDGVAATGWSLDPLGVIDFDDAPEAGAAVTASFAFDVPVRFATDRLEISRASVLAGEAASVPLVEIRDDA